MPKNMSGQIIFAVLTFVFCNLALAMDINDEALVAYWSFDEGQGKIIHDSSQNKLDGELKGDTKWVDGKYGKAIELHSGKDYFVAGNNQAFGLAEVSMTLWMYPYVIGASKGGASMIASDVIWQSSLDYGFHWWTAGGVGWYLWIPSIKGVEISVTTPNKWYFVAGTYDGTTGTLYVNDQKKSDAFPAHTAQGSRPFYTGGETCAPAGWGCSGGWYEGIIDEITLFNRSLTEDEVKEIMNGALAGTKAIVTSGKLTATWGELKSK